MESFFGSRNRHLDASAGREVVFCHACRHEWYHDERVDLECPRCNSEATEIIELGNDPRGDGDLPSPAISSMRSEPRRHSESDPDEADIDGLGDHLRSSQHRRNPRPGAGGQAQDNDVLRRFADMLMNDLGAGRPGRPDPANPFNHRPGDDVDPFGTYPTTRPNGGPTTIHRTTFRSGPVSGSATFTIISSSSNGAPGGADANPFPPGFPPLFGQIISNATPPDGAPRRDPNRNPAPWVADSIRAGTMGANLGPGLQDLLISLLNPPTGVHGDAVYSQEALDRIITSLMEANPQSNAAPPATQAAIDRLEKKKVDDKMLGAEGKAECTICIDDLNKGDEVTVLPCSHWFHGECVTLWLKEHNTCPICRAPIEQRESRGSASQQRTPLQRFAPQPQAQFPSSPPDPFYTRPSPEPTLRFIQSTQRAVQDSNTPWARERRRRESAASSGLPRRNSLSPASRRRQLYGDLPMDSRTRSPSSSRDQDAGVSYYDRDYFGVGTGSGSSTRDNRERNNQTTQSSGHGPLSWLRDHLGRGSGNTSDRDRRR